MRSSPRTASTSTVWAGSITSKGEYGKAAEQLEKAVNLTGDDPTITEHLGDAYAKLGRSEQAGQQYEDALRRSTDQEQVARLKGKLQALRNVGSASH